MPSSEADLASRIDASNLLNKDGTPPTTRGIAPPPEPDPEADDQGGYEADDDQPLDEAPPQDEGAEDDAHLEADDTTTDTATDGEEPPADQDTAQQTMAALREEVAELRGMIQAGLGRRRSKEASATAAGAGAAAPATTAEQRAFASTRAKIEKAREKWGELIDDVGLGDLLNELEADLTSRRTAEQQQKQRAEAAQRQAAVQAHTTFNSGLDTVARSSETLRTMIGQSWRTCTAAQRQNRQALLDETIAQMERSQRLVRAGRRPQPFTEQEATNAAIETFTGSRPAPNTAAAARERGRMVRPAGGSSTEGRPDRPTGEANERQLAGRIDDFFRRNPR